MKRRTITAGKTCFSVIKDAWLTLEKLWTGLKIYPALSISCRSVSTNKFKLKKLHTLTLTWVFFSKEHYATITLNFLDRNSETELKVECRGVPNSEEEQTKEGWKRYYFEAIKQTFGYGARLFWRRCAAVLFSFLLLWFFFKNFLSFDLSGTRWPTVNSLQNREVK